MPDEPNNSWLGKATAFFTFIGVVGTAIGIPYGIGLWAYQAFYPTDSSIVATGEYHPIDLPNYRQTPSEVLVEGIVKTVDKKATFTDSDRMRLVNEVAVLMPRKFPSFHSGDTTYRGYWRVTIENKGRKEANSLQLEIPVEGCYITDRPGDSESIAYFSKVVPIGSLRASSSVNVRIWSDSRGWPDNTRGDYRVTYPDGPTTTVTFPYKVTGWLAWILRNKSDVVTYTFLFLFCTAMAYFFWEMNKLVRRMKSKPKAITETLSSALVQQPKTDTPAILESPQ